MYKYINICIEKGQMFCRKARIKKETKECLYCKHLHIKYIEVHAN